MVYIGFVLWDRSYLKGLSVKGRELRLIEEIVNGVKSNSNFGKMYSFFKI